MGYTRLFYYDIYTQPNAVYTPMVLQITTNETYPGSQIPAASICYVQILYVGSNIPCLISTLYNQNESPFITYSSRLTLFSSSFIHLIISFDRYNQRKNDTVNIQLGPLCNYQTTQTNASLGQIRIGKIKKIFISKRF